MNMQTCYWLSRTTLRRKYVKSKSLKLLINQWKSAEQSKWNCSFDTHRWRYVQNTRKHPQNCIVLLHCKTCKLRWNIQKSRLSRIRWVSAVFFLVKFIPSVNVYTLLRVGYVLNCISRVLVLANIELLAYLSFTTLESILMAGLVDWLRVVCWVINNYISYNSAKIVIITYN